MRQQPDGIGPNQPLRLRQEIERNRRRLLEIDHPATAQVFEKPCHHAQEQLERIEARDKDR